MSEHVPTPANDAEDEGALVVTGRIRIPLDEFEFQYVRSSGPGGQNVNKVATKAQMRWGIAESPNLPDDVRDRFLARYGNRVTNDGEFLVESQRFRSRERNTRDCLDKLRELLLTVATPPRKRKKTKPSRAANKRRLEAKKQRAEKKQRRKRPRFDD